jgi:hypothetical protein
MMQSAVIQRAGTGEGILGVDSMGTARFAAQAADAHTKTTTKILDVVQNDALSRLVGLGSE